ncbi:MAG TPA: hypothetical protein VGI66_03695 [Streptosporangiaceae bacterium]|jgi:hypothetical protein
MTPQGQQASDIADWAFADSSRRDEALNKIRELARAADSDQALREIQDAGTMVSRLAPAARTMPPDTISGQLAGQ